MFFKRERRRAKQELKENLDISPNNMSPLEKAT